MNLRNATSFGSRTVLLLSSIAAGLTAYGAAARATDLRSGEPSARARAMCAAFGPGFAAVQGSDTCVFIGGHVRVGFGSHGSDSPDTGWATGSAVRVNAPDERGAGGIAPGHLRLRDGDAMETIAR
jgi:hypothetical protein